MCHPNNGKTRAYANQSGLVKISASPRYKSMWQSRAAGQADTNAGKILRATCIYRSGLQS